MAATTTATITRTDGTEKSSTNVVTLKEKPDIKEHLRLDYKPPDYSIKHVDLDFSLDFVKTTVVSVLHIHRVATSNSSSTPTPDLVLDGEDLQLVSLALQLKHEEAPKTLDFASLVKKNESLVVPGTFLPAVPEETFKLFITVHINPTTNTELMGLYKAGPMLCTQCEAEGFRRITYFIDRPDVLATFRVRLEAVKKEFPTLLSNGNLVESGEVQASSDRHYAVFEDPYVKPSYLFALVAGDLVLKETNFVRSTGRPVQICLWTEPKYFDRLDWALESIKEAMAWDEKRFGRVYDLDIFNIVAVSFFNMGAMENKSLNIFNAALLLASPATSTDVDFERIRGVVGHEYFHNWTGNRVTCRDWFQLTLKEGLTVYRDQEFSSDLGSRIAHRIAHVRVIRGPQFSEDRGPTAHSIRPESYVSIDNVYTLTVYRKGAEVIRMYATLLGEDGFRKGMDLYFALYDGCAVTCDDFRDAMSCANAVDLTQFEQWYLQAGTPTVTVETTEYDATSRKFKLRLAQRMPTASKSLSNVPLHIPVAVGLLGRSSKTEIVPTTILELTQATQEFVFDNVAEEPLPSILRNFSAPVQLELYLSPDDLGFLLAYDTDLFNRWEAAQRLMTLSIVNAYLASQDAPVDRNQPGFGHLTKALNKELQKCVAKDADVNYEFLALLLTLPDQEELQAIVSPSDPLALHAARELVRKELASALNASFRRVYPILTQSLQASPYAPTQEGRGKRWLRALILRYLCVSDNTGSTCATAYELFQNSDNMTDRYAGLNILTEYYSEKPQTQQALQEFFSGAKDDELVLHKWFSVQASSPTDATLAKLMELKKHSSFDIKNPNAVRALFGQFTRNVPQFHRNDGRGYQLLANVIIELDPINGRVAGRLTTALTTFAQLNSKHRSLMIKQLERLRDQPSLSKHVWDVVDKALTHNAENNKSCSAS